ncbi:hypothetical protein E4T56_gene9867 [Termitomyces sp. T112]|nr:hypothetical protein E4T56_gene9867 [Termitomyces sp. T112]
MPTSNNEVKETLDELADTLLVLVYEQYQVMPNDAKPEVIWTMLAEMTDKIIGVSKRLATMSDRVSPNIISEGTSNGARGEPVRAMSIIKGAQRVSRADRNAVFDNERRNLPTPRKDLSSECTARILHEMIFVDSDCFLSLSSIQPGSHGWIIVFRNELKDWLLSAVEPFHVLYEDRDRKKTYFGIYTARLLARASMNGAEIACLNDTVREIIVTAISKSELGSKPYNAMLSKLLMSLETLPCILLQCIEFLPVMYPNFMADVTQLAQSVPKRLAPSRPPGFHSPVSASVKQERSKPPSQPHAEPVPPSVQCQGNQSSQQVSWPTDIEKTPKAQCSTRSMSVRKRNGVSDNTPSSYGGRWHNIGDLNNTPRGSGGAFSGHHQSHQNNNLVNDSDRILVPLQRNGPQPPQFSVYRNYQPPNPQSNASLVSYQGVVPNLPNPGLRLKSQSHSATYGPGFTRGYQVQNQNINPICNPLLINSPSGLPVHRVPDRSLHSRAPASLSSQNFPFPQHGMADPRFRDS